ncbi:hypothetical protein [Streptomyces europaeiscabiei]|uniref:hypothetical protein n=1 Tax=Streptomyces europaeiscabiei TaxID=146819 RepID=UPI002E2AAC15|nr:hypothetical protein [Streptomyces europaeiscabiei]
MPLRTALCAQGIRDIAESLGRDIPLRYAPADPSLLTADPDHERRERASHIRFVATLLATGIAAIGVGGYCLHHPWPFT